MRENRDRIVVTGAGAALAVASLEITSRAGDDTIFGAPPPGSGQRFRPSPPYQPKTPTTAADHERLRLAEAKRARKAKKRGFAPVGSASLNQEPKC